MDVIREGLVVRNLDGTAKTDTQAVRAIERICRRAGLPVRLWHTLRRSFGTHAALCGVNPWTLQAWHARELPEPIRNAARGVEDPDRRVLAMLGARGSVVAAGSINQGESETVTAS